MSNFVRRVYTPLGRTVWGKELETFLESRELGLYATAVVDDGQEDDPDAEPIAFLFTDEEERDVATLVYGNVESEDARDDLEELRAAVDEMFPEVNREWVRERLSKTVGCYYLTIIEYGYSPEIWDDLSALTEWLRKEANGIEDGDDGFVRNEDGAVVLDAPDDFYDDEEEVEFTEDDFEDDDFDDEDLDDEFDDKDDSEEQDSEEGASIADWEGYQVAIRDGNDWKVREISSEEERQEFLDGSLEF